MRSTIEQPSVRVPPSVPEVAFRRRPATGLIVTAIAVVLALVAGSILVVEQRRIAARDDRIAAVTAQLADSAGASKATVDRLNGRIERLQAKATADGARIRALEARLLAVAGPPLPDGRHFGYFSTAVGGQHPRVLIDLALFLTDQTGQAAAAAHGDEFVNGYYVVNDSQELRTVALSPDATVWIVGPNSNAQHTVQVPMTEWIDAMTSGMDMNAMSNHHDGYWFEVANGRIVRLEEQWVP